MFAVILQGVHLKMQHLINYTFTAKLIDVLVEYPKLRWQPNENREISGHVNRIEKVMIVHLAKHTQSCTQVQTTLEKAKGLKFRKLHILDF